MLRSCAKLIRGGVALCNHPTILQTNSRVPRHFSISRPHNASEFRDYGLPNASWSQKLQDLFNNFQELSKKGSWKRIPSYNSTVHHMGEVPPSEKRERRLFTRNLDKDGVGFEYTMFYNKAEKRTVCLFQSGPYLEGPPGFTHGGCIATIIDSTAGAGVLYSYGPVMTANLNINYRNPIPLGHTVIVDSKVEKTEGRKVYATCHIRSHDDKVIHTEATALFIKLNP
ncbi:acyl-coenzyme A thioesterase THEM4 isoform X2 [Pelobates fuscus]